MYGVQKKCISINIKENKGHQIKRYEKKTNDKYCK